MPWCFQHASFYIVVQPLCLQSNNLLLSAKCQDTINTLKPQKHSRNPIQSLATQSNIWIESPTGYKLNKTAGKIILNSTYTKPSYSCVIKFTLLKSDWRRKEEMALGRCMLTLALIFQFFIGKHAHDVKLQPRANTVPSSHTAQEKLHSHLRTTFIRPRRLYDEHLFPLVMSPKES